MPMAAVGVMAAGAGLGAYGSYQQGKAEKAMYKYNAAVAENEALQQERLGVIEQDELLDQRRKQLATITTLYGKSGVMMAGSPVDTTMETSKVMTLDASLVRWNHKVKSTQFKNQAQLDRYSGKQAFKAGQIGAWSSILGGGSQIASFGNQAGWFDKKTTTTGVK